MSNPSPPSDATSFEDAMQRLDEIVTGMEDNQLPLEQMITSYEEGVRLLKVCRQRIEGARRRVELITADAEGGKATLTPFVEDSAPEEDAAESAEKLRPQNRRRKLAEPETDSGEIRLF